MYLTLKGLPINGLRHHVINLVRNVFWNYLCLSDYPHPHARDMRDFKFRHSDHTVNQSWSEQLVDLTRYNVINTPRRNITILEVEIVPLSDRWPWLPLAPSATEMPPSLLNPLFLTLRIAVAEKDSRWGDFWLFVDRQESALAITEKLDVWHHNQLHATCRTNQLSECSCLQPIRTCHVTAGTHNPLNVCSF
jgi:hypothetical protein